MLPLISIIIPTYNSMNYISNICDYFNKHVSDCFEVIFIDDCSTDGTYDFLMARKDDNIFQSIVIQNETNLGPGITRNKGLREAKGKYISFESDYITGAHPEVLKWLTIERTPRFMDK